MVGCPSCSCAHTLHVPAAHKAKRVMHCALFLCCNSGSAVQGVSFLGRHMEGYVVDCRGLLCSVQLQALTLNLLLPCTGVHHGRDGPQARADQ